MYMYLCLYASSTMILGVACSHKTFPSKSRVRNYYFQQDSLEIPLRLNIIYELRRITTVFFFFFCFLLILFYLNFTKIIFPHLQTGLLSVGVKLKKIIMLVNLLAHNFKNFQLNLPTPEKNEKKTRSSNNSNHYSVTVSKVWMWSTFFALFSQLTKKKKNVIFSSRIRCNIKKFLKMAVRIARVNSSSS